MPLVEAHLHRGGAGTGVRIEDGIEARSGADVGDNDLQVVCGNDLADDVFDLADQLVGQFQPGARGRLEVDQKLAGIRPREIALTHQRVEGQADQEQTENHRNSQDRATQRYPQVSLVAVQHAGKLVVEPGIEALAPALCPGLCGLRVGAFAVMAVRRLDQIRAKQRHHRHGHEIRSEQGQHERDSQRAEQELAHAVEEGDWKHHHHQGQGSGEYRQGHFLPSPLGSDHWRLAHLQVPIDVLQHHHRIVYQPRKGQRQPPQNHRVDSVASQGEREERRQRREGN